jgi:hypothetical protein
MTDTSTNDQGEGSEKTSTIANLDSIFEDSDDADTNDEGTADKKAGTESGDEGDGKSKDENAEGDDDASEDDDTDEGDDGDEEEGDADGESETSTDEDKKPVPMAALKAERKKRQALEQENAELRAKIDPPTNDDPEPDVTEDPEAYKAWVKRNMAREEWHGRATASRTRIMDKHDDYEKLEATFYVLAKLDPNLVKEMKAHPEPAQFAYDKGKEYFDGIRAEIRAEIEAEGADESDGKAKKAKSKDGEQKPSAKQVPKLNNAASAKSKNDTAKGSGLSEVLADSPF